MSLKEKLDVALTLYAKEATPEFRSAIQKIITEYDDKRKAFDFCLDELSITKNQLVQRERDMESLLSQLSAKENDVVSLTEKLVVQKKGVSEMEALLKASDDHIKDYMGEREKKEAEYETRIAELDSRLHVELENKLKLRVQTELAENYVNVCNNLFSRNQAMTKQLLAYEEKINKGCCTRLLGIRLERAV